jgi:DNA-binding winged helix-turn-helix (wHTH) protein
VKYAFGTLSVDADARSISSAEGPVHLTRKAFDLLLLLLECRSKVLSKDDIYARLWHDSFVTESSLQTLVHEIRQTIDQGGSPSWIRTVHGIGYSFAGEVLVSEPPARSVPPEPPAAWLFNDSARVALYRGANVLGRGSDDVIEIEAPTISRRHARINIEDSITLEDLGSKNGTWLRDERLTGSRALVDGDVLRLGSEQFTIRLARRPKSTVSADLFRNDLDVPSG